VYLLWLVGVRISQRHTGSHLLIAARDPSAHRSLIACTAWSSFAHALVMGTMAFQFANQCVGFLWGSVVLAVIGVALIVLAPAKASAAFASAPADYCTTMLYEARGPFIPASTQMLSAK